MGLFDKWKEKKPEAPKADWENAFAANVNFYGKEGEEPFGALVLTEGTETILPKAPWKRYGLDGKPVATWKLVLVSITNQGIMGMADYAGAMARLKPYLQDEREDAVLTKGLTLSQMETILK